MRAVVHFGGRADNHIGAHAAHGVGVARLADADDFAVADADIGLDDAAVVDNHHIGDGKIEHVFIAAAGRGRLRHAVAHRFAAAEFAFIAFGEPILLDGGKKAGVAQADFVAHRGAVSGQILRTRDGERGFVGSLRRGWNFAIGFIAETLQDLGAAKRHQLHRFALARLEAHGVAAGDIQAEAFGRFALELQRGIGFKKMIMRADLNRAVAQIGHTERARFAAEVGGNVAFGGQVFTGVHGRVSFECIKQLPGFQVAFSGGGCLKRGGGWIFESDISLLIRQLNIEHFQMPANKPLVCCPLPSPLPREREQVSAAGKRM